MTERSEGIPSDAAEEERTPLKPEQVVETMLRLDAQLTSCLDVLNRYPLSADLLDAVFTLGEALKVLEKGDDPEESEVETP